MKKLFLVLSMSLLLVGCSERGGEEIIICDQKLHFGSAEDYFDVRVVFKAKDNYIESISTSGRLDMNSRIEDLIRDKYNSNRKTWIKWMENDYGIIFDTGDVEIQDFGDHLIIDMYEENEPRPEGWRGLIIPEDKKLSTIVEYYSESRQGGCES